MRGACGKLARSSPGRTRRDRGIHGRSRIRTPSPPVIPASFDRQAKSGHRSSMSVSTLPAAAIAAPVPAALAPASPRRAEAQRNHGERLAVVTTAVAVAMMPLAIPRGPQNLAPADVFIGIAVTACFAWAVASRWRCRFPFALAMCVFMAAGAIAAFVGPVPLGGVVAILQDFELLVWCWALVNIASSP